jgi:hypothetical protein
MWRRQEQDRCEYLDCGKPAQIYKLVAAAGGLDPDDCQIGMFCSGEHADRIPSPTPEAKARAKAKLDARVQAKRGG